MKNLYSSWLSSTSTDLYGDIFRSIYLTVRLPAFVNLRYGRSLRCEIVHAPSDAIHFLQPCDQNVNKIMKKAVNELRDKLHTTSSIDLSSFRVALILGVHEFHSITLELVQ